MKSAEQKQKELEEMVPENREIGFLLCVCAKKGCDIMGKGKGVYILK